MPSQTSIDGFLAQGHIALVGMSRNPKDFTAAVAQHLRAGGRTVYPVNPATDVIDGQRCYHSLSEVPEPLDGVLVMVPADRSATVVQECIDRGVRRVWLHRGAGTGAVSPEAVRLGRDAGLDVVDGACPLMFAPPVGWFHKTHRFFVRRHIAA